MADVRGKIDVQGSSSMMKKLFSACVQCYPYDIYIYKWLVFIVLHVMTESRQTAACAVSCNDLSLLHDIKWCDVASRDSIG